jgi:hypothetical protein
LLTEGAADDQDARSEAVIALVQTELFEHRQPARKPVMKTSIRLNALVCYPVLPKTSRPWPRQREPEALPS